MATFNRSDLIHSTFRVLRKHYAPVAAPPDRSVLEHLLYACCLENNPFDKADAAFQRIKAMSFDWNEVRVTSVSELAESMHGFHEPKRTAASFRQLLQSVFDANYSFDLEHWRKQNLGKTIKELEKHQGATQFVVSYVTQQALAGHAIPLDRGALDAMQILGVISEKERARESVPGLERAVPKKHGVEFSSLLHHLAADLVASPFGAHVRSILQEIDPACKDRLPKRPSKKRPAAENGFRSALPPDDQASQPTERTAPRATPSKKSDTPPPAAAPKSSDKSSIKKSPPTAKPAFKKPELKQPDTRKTEVKKPPTKKPVTKQPAARKPESKKSETKKTDVKKPQSKKPQIKKSETKKPESKKPETKKPATGKPETKSPGKPSPGKPGSPASHKPDASARRASEKNDKKSGTAATSTSKQLSKKKPK